MPIMVSVVFVMSSFLKNGWNLILLRQHAFNALKHTRGRIEIVYDTL